MMRDDDLPVIRRTSPGGRRAPLPQWWWNMSLRGRRTIASGVVVALLVLLVAGVQWVRSGEPDPDRFVAQMTPARVQLWDDMAQCESEGDWSANTGNGYYGGLQFSITSWEEVGGEIRPDLATRNEQIMRAEMLSELQGFQAWPFCSAQLGLT